MSQARGDDGAPALVIRNLLRRFGPKAALDNLSLVVPSGCLFGLLGPKGAGKTTSLGMATGLLRPDAGQVEFWGHDVWSDPVAAKAMMGVLPDGLRLFDRPSGLELLRFAAGMRGVAPDQIEPRAEALLHALGLTADADTLVCDHSAGMTKKSGLAARWCTTRGCWYWTNPTRQSIRSRGRPSGRSSMTSLPVAAPSCFPAM